MYEALAKASAACVKTIWPVAQTLAGVSAASMASYGGNIRKRNIWRKLQHQQLSTINMTHGYQPGRAGCNAGVSKWRRG